jgi:hypothetical protein
MLGDPEPCGDRSDEAARKQRLERHRRGKQPVPPGWLVAIDPQTPTLAPEAVIPVTASITPPSGFTGSQQLSVNAFHREGLAGGVTLTVIGP